MSLNQFVDLSVKKWMKIGAQQLSVGSIAYPSNINLNGGSVVTQPVSLYASFPSGQQTLNVCQNAYFSLYGASLQAGNGSAVLVIPNGTTVGINYTSYTTGTLVIGITGYYQFSFGADATFAVGDVGSTYGMSAAMAIQNITTSATLGLSTVANPNNNAAVSSNPMTFPVKNSGIAKFNAGDSVALASFVSTSIGVINWGNISMALNLIDSVTG